MNCDFKELLTILYGCQVEYLVSILAREFL